MKRIITIPDILKKPHPNPYQRLLYKAMAGEGIELVTSFDMDFVSIWKNRRKADVIHIHWQPASEGSGIRGYVRSVRLFFQFLFCRLAGIKIIWTAHNLFPHDTKDYSLQYFQRLWLVRVCNLIFVHFEGAKALISQKFWVSPRKMITVHHGLYDQVYPNTVTKEQARTFCRIDNDKKVFLYFGLIKPYKNLEAVVAAFKKLQDPNAVLLLAGNVTNPEYKQAIIALMNDNRIQYEFSYIDDKNVQYYFNACDCVILPYQKIFTSGAALLAMTFHKPIIMKRCDFSTEYLSGHASHHLIDECDEEHIHKAMESFLKAKGQTALSDADIKRFKWSNIIAHLAREERFKRLFAK